MFDYRDFRLKSSWLPPVAKDGKVTKVISPHFKECHKGVIKISDNPDVYLGGRSRSMNPSEWSKDHPDGLLIDLAGVVYTDLASNYGFSLSYTTKCIQIHWEDWSACKLDATDWNSIAEEVNRVGEALIFCQGGHGRTGTAAAILLTLFGKCNGPEATGHVRSKYCVDAVESLEQTKYLDDLLGLQIERAAPRIPFYLNQKGGFRDLNFGQQKRTKEEDDEREKWFKEMEENNYGYGM